MADPGITGNTDLGILQKYWNIYRIIDSPRVIDIHQTRCFNPSLEGEPPIFNRCCRHRVTIGIQQVDLTLVKVDDITFNGVSGPPAGNLEERNDNCKE